MISIHGALQKILVAVTPLPAELVPLAEAAGRFTSGETKSPVNLPPHDNSSVDGYAVRAEDLASATVQSPVTLSLAGYSPAGGAYLGTLQPGECVRIFTGSVMPRGADAVVMQEDVETEPSQPRSVIFREKVRPFDNVRFLGEDVQQHTVLVGPGEKLTAGRVGLLAAAGMEKVACRLRPTVALIATGSELREAGHELEPGAIYESNRLSLSILVKQTGAIPKTPPLVTDDLDATKFSLERAFQYCDAVVTTGGVSVGDLDWVRRAFTEIGGELDFFGVELRPGKPFAFGRLGKKLFFALPGNPVSAMVTFFLLVRPALLRMQGVLDVLPPYRLGRLAEPLDNDGGRRHFMRVTLDTAGDVRSAGKQASHILRATALSDGLVEVPPNTTLPAGSMVNVLLWS